MKICVPDNGVDSTHERLDLVDSVRQKTGMRAHSHVRSAVHIHQTLHQPTQRVVGCVQCLRYIHTMQQVNQTVMCPLVAPSQL